MSKADKLNNHLYNLNLKGYAIQNRKTMTKAESCLWKYVLKNKQMRGFQFHRQRPVLNYIADFMCKELKLIIEVDGITHTFESVAQKDIYRQTNLERSGFIVLRFTDNEVLHSINRVRNKIEDCIRELRIH